MLPHVTITQDALDLTVQYPRRPPPLDMGHSTAARAVRILVECFLVTKLFFPCIKVQDM